MYPFERFTEQAKKTLTLAQTEAEAGGQHYIGTEHLLLAVASVAEGLGAKVLRGLGVEDARLREEVRERQAAPEQVGPGGMLPTSRVKKVIELAFREADRTGSAAVGTGQLLIGLLEEGGSIGAGVLGVTLDAARAEVERALASGEGAEARVSAGPEGTVRRRFSPELATLMAAAQRRADGEAAPAIRVDHLLRAMGEDAEAAKILAHLGMDVAAMATRLTPPASLFEAQAALRALQRKKEEAIGNQDYETAARFRNEERQARLQHDQAQRDWLDSWLAV